MFGRKKEESKQQAKASLNVKLTQRIKELEEQVVSLQEELEVERNKPKEGYEEAKRLIADLTDKQKEYRRLMDELYKYRDIYQKKAKECDEVKEKYQKEFDKLLTDFRSDFKK